MSNRSEVRNSKILSWAIDDCLKKPLGQILLEAGLISINQLEIALKEQQESGLEIGEIIALYKWVDRKTVVFFAERWKKLIQAKTKQPLIYYFQESGLLSESQIQTLLEKSEYQEKKSRFHHLVVEAGLLKQVTVDYFLTYLFGLYSPSNVPLDKPYTILKEYVRGKTDFQNSNLAKVSLMNVCLTGIKLDGSNLRKANLRDCDLSYSSLVSANLSRADLTQALLKEINFEQTNLRKANLRNANLEKAKFSQANLQEADLRNACLAGTFFEKSDLRGTKLMSEYAYEVYYDDHTVFDPDFSPQEIGWKKLDTVNS